MPPRVPPAITPAWTTLPAPAAKPWALGRRARGLIALAVVLVWFVIHPPWRGLRPQADVWLSTPPYPAQVLDVQPGGVVTVTSQAQGDQTITLASIHCPNPLAEEYWAPAAPTLVRYRGQWMMVKPVRRGPGGTAVASLLQATGERLEVTLVRAGWCRWDRSTAPGDKELAQAERDAQQAHGPIWRRSSRLP